MMKSVLLNIGSTSECSQIGVYSGHLLSNLWMRQVSFLQGSCACTCISYTCIIHDVWPTICTVQRLLGADEDPSEVVDFWGKSKVSRLAPLILP